uniref:Uncharacterized protein n=1 Tax=viral metagenome TaxID=1070528 RepID=A0A6C0HZP4_9ZZZZ
MSAISEEIQKLQSRLLELEKNENISNKKTDIVNDVQSTSYYDEEIVKHLEVIYNILQIINKRLQILEQK